MMPAFIGYVARFGASVTPTPRRTARSSQGLPGALCERDARVEDHRIWQESKSGIAVMPPPDFDSVAPALVSIGLRIVNKNLGPKGGLSVNPGVLPSLDGGTGGGGLVDRGPDGQTPGLFELHDLGEITVISDPGISGKNMCDLACSNCWRRLRRATLRTSSCGNSTVVAKPPRLNGAARHVRQVRRHIALGL